MKYVLDTNIVARLLDGDARVVPRVAGLTTDDVGMPLVVLAELLFGVEKSARRAQNRARLEGFAADRGGPSLPSGSACDPLFAYE